MTTSDKIALSSNRNQLVFFREGIFYKLYNRHAFFFVENIKPFKVSVNYIKAVKQDVFSVGFPVNAFDTAPKKVKEEEERIVIKDVLIELGADIKAYEDKIVAENICCENNTLYNKWCFKHKELSLLRANEKAYKKKSIKRFEELQQKLLSFNVSNSTPIEAMDFLMKIQNKIRK